MKLNNLGVWTTLSFEVTMNHTNESKAPNMVERKFAEWVAVDQSLTGHSTESAPLPGPASLILLPQL